METKTVVKKFGYLPLAISGSDGWLVWVQIGLWLTLMTLFVQLFEASLPSLLPGIWNLMTSPDSEYYHPMLETVLILEAVHDVAFFAFTVFVIVCFLRELWIVPRLIIIYFSSKFLFDIVDTWLIFQIPLAKEASGGSGILNSVRSLITCLIWIPYFLRSARVRNTFIR